jgi:hypothetical protein
MPEWIRLQADAYLALLVVFLAPVLAVPEILSVYRVHGKNLHAANVHNAGQHQQRLDMRKAIFEAVEKWLDDHDFDLKRRDIKIFFEQLFLFLWAEDFELRAPRRSEFFRYMMRRTKLYWNGDGWKLRVMNSFNTLAGPLIGYEKFLELYKAEVRSIGLLQRLASRHP